MSEIITNIQKQTERRNLYKYTTLITDNSQTSPNYFNISQLGDEFALGKNGFLMRATDNLVNNSPILIEILDANGEVIYHEIPDYKEDVSRVVSVWVYENTAFGPSLITIMGEAKFDMNENAVPSEWQRKYNLKWQRKINVNPNIYNENKVRFFKRPNIEINGQTKPNLLPIYTGSNRERQIDGTDGEISFRITPNSYGNTLHLLETHGFSLRKDMYKKRFVVFDSSLPFDDNLVLQIEDIVSDTRCYVSKITKKYNDYYQEIQLNTDQFALTYLQEPIDYIITEGDYTKLNIRVNNLKTITGNVFRTRIYTKNLNANEPYKFLGDYEIFPIELLTDTLNSLTGERWAGIFYSQDDIDEYLIGSNLIHNDDKLLNSVTIDQPYDDGIVREFTLNPAYITDTLLEYSEYSLSFKALMDNEDISIDAARIEVLLFGNAFENQTVKIAELKSVENKYLYKEVEKSFKAIRNGSFNILFRVHGGKWYFTDISIKPLQEEGFSPDYTRISFPFEYMSEETEANLKFKLDLFDLNNNKIPYTIESETDEAIFSVDPSFIEFIIEDATYLGDNEFELSYSPITTKDILVFVNDQLINSDEYVINDNILTLIGSSLSGIPTVKIAYYYNLES